MAFDLELRVKVSQNIVQYSLNHVTYAATKFEVARSNGLGGDTLTRNVADARTHVRTDRQTDDGLTLVQN